MVGLPEPTEAEFQRAVLQLAKLRGWRVAHFRGVRVQRANGSVHHVTPQQGDAGFPDLILVRKGVILVRELKRWSRRNKFETGQQEWIAELGEHGGVWTDRDWERIQHELR